jgi:hypothetical protein
MRRTAPAGPNARKSPCIPLHLSFLICDKGYAHLCKRSGHPCFDTCACACACARLYLSLSLSLSLSLCISLSLSLSFSLYLSLSLARSLSLSRSLSISLYLSLSISLYRYTTIDGRCVQLCWLDVVGQLARATEGRPAQLLALGAAAMAVGSYAGARRRRPQESAIPRHEFPEVQARGDAEGV